MTDENDVRNSVVLEARGVHRAFGPTQALRGADITVRRGEMVAVMGPSGSGKSTLLHVLAGIYTPDEGEVWFDGRRVDRMSEAQRTELRRRDFGFVFQFGQLVPELTALDNIALPLLLAKVPRKRAYAQAEPWLERLGLADRGSHRSGELSGGQAQRVAIARALVAKPQVLFADEPTGALDTLTGETVMNLLVTTAREEGATVILVTHDARVAAYAGREVIVRDGKAMSLHQGPETATPPPAAKAAHNTQTAQAANAQVTQTAQTAQSTQTAQTAQTTPAGAPKAVRP
jgi:putative ABC transport system ATP-binding protein